ncbi:MAG: HAD family hydrolase [Actinomycetes bacterium]
MGDRPSGVVIFDLDGTLIDSDAALVAPFVALGVAPEAITFGHAIAEECERLGLSLDDYVAAYDAAVVEPYPGVEQMLGALDRWAICSNKHPQSGWTELERLGWRPEVTMFADAFDWKHKTLAPILDQLGVTAAEVVMVGDSAGDARCAQDAGCAFAWAGWNPRVLSQGVSGTVLARPSDLLGLLGIRS